MKKLKPLKISARDLNTALEKFPNDEGYLASLMEGLAKVGKTNSNFIGFKRGTYAAYKDNPKHASVMSMFAGFALGWEMRSLQTSSGKSIQRQMKTVEHHPPLVADSKDRKTPNFTNDNLTDEMRRFLERQSDWSSAICVNADDPRAKQTDDNFTPMTDEERKNWIDPAKVFVYRVPGKKKK